MRVASFRARLLAALVQAAVVTLGTAAVAGLVLGGAAAYSRIRGTNDNDHPDRDTDEEDVSTLGLRRDRDDVGDPNGSSRKVQRGPLTFFEARPGRAAVWGASAGLAVASRNWRSPGYRLFGLRRVDARTGGAISVRSALAGFLLGRAQQAIAGLMFVPRMRRVHERVTGLEPELEAIKRTYATDPEGRQRAVSELYPTHTPRPTTLWGWWLAGPILSQLVLALGIRDGRTVYDRLTGTTVVTDC
jgi:hypothetical protein